MITITITNVINSFQSTKLFKDLFYRKSTIKNISLIDLF